MKEVKNGEIIIRGSLCDLNKYIKAERSNRFAGAKIKKEQTEYVQWQIKNLLPITDYPVHVSFTWFSENKRKDPDNISSFGRKVILDAMQKEGILKNDSQRYISSFSDYFFVDKENPRVEIEITKKLPS